jgi:hypothetical protein
MLTRVHDMLDVGYDLHSIILIETLQVLLESLGQLLLDLFVLIFGLKQIDNEDHICQEGSLVLLGLSKLVNDLESVKD